MRRTKKAMMGCMAWVLAAAVMAGCSSQENQGQSAGNGEGQSFKIGISQIVNHKALNDAREGFEERLQELGINADVNLEIADGDVPTAQLIAEKFVAEKMDLIYAIATPAAQTAQNATKNNKLPVIFSAVTDPVKAGLSGEHIKDNNITGVTDEASIENITELLNVARSLRSEKNAIGIIYNTAETNAVSQVETIETLAKTMELKVVPVPISGLTDIDQALEIVSSKADALYLINDNMVASSVEMIASKARDKKLITVSTDSSHVEGGALFSIGISYKQLGRQAADMAKLILADKVSPADIPVENSQKLFRFINKKVAETMGIDISKLATADATIIE